MKLSFEDKLYNSVGLSCKTIDMNSPSKVDILVENSSEIVSGPTTLRNVDSDENVCVRSTPSVRISEDEESVPFPNLYDKSVHNSSSIDLSQHSETSETCHSPLLQSVRKKKSKLRQLGSDLDSDDDNINQTIDSNFAGVLEPEHNDKPFDEENSSESKPLHRRRLKAAVLDSDSEEEDIYSTKSDGGIPEHSLCSPSSTSKSPDLKPSKNVTSCMSKFQNSDIYDAEGSSDESCCDEPVVLQIEDESNNKIDKKKADSAKRKSIPQRKSKQTALEEIRSETQRLVRQSRVALPYHQPKQHSLSEFLSKRKVPIIPLKTSTDQLTEVWQSLEEREKIAESFYNSDNDTSEDETDKIDGSTRIIKEQEDPAMCSTDIVVEKNGSADVTNSEAVNCASYEDVTARCNCPAEAPCNCNYSKIVRTVNSHHESGSNDTLAYNSMASDSAKTTVTSDSLLDTNKTIETETFEYSESSSLNFNLSENTVIEMSNFKSSGELTLQSSTVAETIIKESCDITDSGIFGSDETGKIDCEFLSKSEKNALSVSKGENQSAQGKTDKVSEESIKFESSEKVEIKKKYNSLLHNTLLDIKLDSKPKISGSPDSFIDLSEGSEKPTALQLVSRFIKHTKLKPRVKKQEEKISVAITEVNEKGEIISLDEEIINVKVTENSKPCGTRTQLKTKLKEEMARRREKEFVKRIEEYKMSEELFEDDSKDVICDDIEEIEEEFQISESSETESEPEEDDILISDKVKKDKGNPFFDEEAEESDNNEDGEGNDYEFDEGDGESAGEDCEDVPPSINVAPLLDEKVRNSNDLIQDGPGLDSGSGFSGLCSGAFPTQGLNLEDLEKEENQRNEQEKTSDLSFSELDNDVAEDLDDDKKSENRVGDNDSSDEEIFTKKAKKKVKLSFSDDEDGDDLTTEPYKKSEEEEEKVVSEDESVDETVNSEEDEDDKKTDVIDEEEEEFLNNPSVAAKRFFEDEAELSGSEYGSADEEEGDLDNYEEEQGDHDSINQRKLRTELERLHMKNILDDDKREIRVLQELLLEDGELHSDGPKRQRQFKWYNQDGNNEERPNYSDEEDAQKAGPEEEEEDESWRKTRLERENFLLDMQNDDDAFNQFNSINIIEPKIVKSSPKISLAPKVNSPGLQSPNPRKQFTLITKRGSFLSRSDKVLSKLAEITNVPNEKSIVNTRGKKNMVFAVVSPPKEKEPIEQVNKRKNEDQLPAVSKRLKYAPMKMNLPRQSVFEKLKMSET